MELLDKLIKESTLLNFPMCDPTGQVCIGRLLFVYKKTTDEDFGLYKLSSACSRTREVISWKCSACNRLIDAKDK